VTHAENERACGRTNDSAGTLEDGFQDIPAGRGGQARGLEGTGGISWVYGKNISSLSKEKELGSRGDLEHLDAGRPVLSRFFRGGKGVKQISRLDRALVRKRDRAVLGVSCTGKRAPG